MALPLAISPGVTQSLLIRGLKLDQATAVQFPNIEPAVEVRILKQEKSAPPDKLESMDVGDTQVEVTFQLPAEFAADSLPLTVTTPDGITSHFSLLIVPADQLTTESEPNDSFRKPQTVTFGQTISGMIAQPKDVDVFEFVGKAGQSFVAEVFAAQQGSPCDVQLTLFDSSGHILCISDDAPRSRDPALLIQLPRTDTYRLAVLDATDRGSSLSAYLLQVRVE